MDTCKGRDIGGRNCRREEFVCVQVVVNEVEGGKQTVCKQGSA